jgi:hypothetical protein
VWCLIICNLQYGGAAFAHVWALVVVTMVLQLLPLRVAQRYRSASGHQVLLEYILMPHTMLLPILVVKLHQVA